MLPYFLLLFTTSALATVAQSRHFSPGIVGLLWASVVLALTLFAGLRSDSVGADTMAYVGRFDYLVSLNTVWDTAGSAELGHKAMLAISRILSDNPTAFLVVSSCFAAILYATAIYRLAQVPALALFAYIAFGFFVFHMNGLRQGIALGVIMHSLPSLLAGRPLRFAAWLGVAFLFHSSAVLVILAYPLARLSFSILGLSVLALGSIFVTVSFEAMFQIVGVVNERYALYAQRTEVGGAMLTLFHVLVAAVFMLGRPVVRRAWRDEYDKLFITFLFGAMIHVIVQVTGSYVEMSRMALYFTVTMTFLWPLLIRSISQPSLRILALAVFFLSGTFYYFTFLNQIGGYVPYEIR